MATRLPATHHTFCRICESLCGLEVTTDGERVVEIHPDPSHVATDGFSCPKGLKQHHLYASPDRLTVPEKRIGTRWQKISWEQATSEIGAKVKQLRADHGADSIAMYVGTAAGFGVLHPVFAQGFMTGLGSRSMYSSASQDCSNKFAVARELYGFPFTQPFPDLDRTRCLIIVGANPVVSKWSFLQVPNPARALQGIRERGGYVAVVDPRFTETAKVADEHLFIRPGTDVFFYLSFLDELVKQGGIDRARVAQHLRGFDALEALAARWPKERTAPVTRVSPEALAALVTRYRTAHGAALYCSTGVNMGGNGALAFWVQEAINAASGNLDREGGTLVSVGVIDFAAFGKKTGTLMRTDASRVGGFAAVNDGFPGGVLPDEILTPGERQVRALFVTGGNPLITMADAGRTRQAFEALELLVTLDLFKNETGSLAHYVLPCTSPLERPDLPFVFPMMLGLQRKPYLQATRAVVEPLPTQRDEASIYLELCEESGVGLFGSKVAQRLLMGWLKAHSAFFRRGQPAELPQEALLSLILRLTGQGSFEGLLDEPHGKALPPHRPGSFLGQRVLTDDGRVDVGAPKLLARAERLEADFALELERPAQLKLITKRHVTTHNSWTHNFEGFVSGERRTNHLYVHPDDAKRLGLHDGALADVKSATAAVRVPVKLLADLMPGTVALPHGWGHQHAEGLSVAKQTEGVNVNLLAASGPGALDPVSGMAHLTGIPVEVTQASGPRAHTWSGLPDAAVASEDVEARRRSTP